jgi:hypothetical protein
MDVIIPDPHVARYTMHASVFQQHACSMDPLSRIDALMRRRRRMVTMMMTEGEVEGVTMMKV